MKYFEKNTKRPLRSYFDLVCTKFWLKFFEKNQYLVVCSLTKVHGPPTSFEKPEKSDK